MSHNHLLVSCFFGIQRISISDAPVAARSVFFTNSDANAATAASAGWEPVLLNDVGFPLSDDLRISSIQAKYVKFLQFRHDFKDLARYSITTYCDQNACIQDKQLLEFTTRMDSEKSVLIRSSPSKKGLTKEIEQSKKQPRYDVSMDETLQWLEKIRKHDEISDTKQIANTGMIHTTRVEKMMPLYEAVYNAIIDLDQPQCQIIWNTLSQKYADDIHQVGWNDLQIPWGGPAVNRHVPVLDKKTQQATENAKLLEYNVQLTEKNTQLTKKNAQLIKNNAQLRKELKLVKSDRTRIATDHSNMLNSTSWKVTKPLRSISQLVKKLTG